MLEFEIKKANKFGFRSGLLGKIILQVSERLDTDSPRPIYGWRDATVSDLEEYYKQQCK